VEKERRKKKGGTIHLSYLSAIEGVGGMGGEGGGSRKKGETTLKSSSSIPILKKKREGKGILRSSCVIVAPSVLTEGAGRGIRVGKPGG